ncbi:MAG: patatin-like protein [Acidobacteriota bacterium]
MAALTTPNVDYKKEIRFAVVMYGGVSLAIYINGVAQELLRMVKATAPRGEGEKVARDLGTTGDKPCGTEAVYRKLSYLIDDLNLRAELRNKLVADKKAIANWHPDGYITVRFIVDVLAGTSAGGINSIYLAKALANDQDIDKLKNLWVTEGDIHLLINDSKSLKDTTLSRQKPPQSLLNSRRLYLKLLAALDAMDARTKEKHSPLVDELDLYITATDIRGLALPIRLADAVVFERRHKNVFRFKYMTRQATGSDVNEFRKQLNPFLAFAARTTSSFPFAFEPVRLSDIRDLLDHSEEHRAVKDNFKPDSPLIRRFFQDNLTQDVEFGSVNYDLRSFADGGYLDNKPFSYATSTLTRRTPTVPVDRKLIYVEPSPEHPEREVQPNEPPDAIQNVMAALDLPRYETIREDIQAVLDRNRLIERVNRLTRVIERDIETYEGRVEQFASKMEGVTDPRERAELKRKEELNLLSTTVKAALKDDPEKQEELAKQMRKNRPEVPPKLWDAMQLSDMVGLYGLHYLPYRRLRMSALTDEIATLTARVVDVDERSAMFQAVRALVQTWRDETYSDDEPKEGTSNRFLNRFDLSYRLRRLNFLVAKVDELLCLFDWHGKGDVFESKTAKRLVQKLDKAWNDLLRINPDKGKPEDFDFVGMKTTAERQQAVRFLLYLKCELNQSFIELRKFGRDLRRSPGKTIDPQPTRAAVHSMAAVFDPEGEKRYQEINEYKDKVRDIGLTVEHLKLVLGATANGNRIELDDAAVACLGEDDALLRAQALWDNCDKYGLKGLPERFKAAGAHLEKILSSVFVPSRARSKQLLEPQGETYESHPRCAEKEGARYFTKPFATAIRGYLWHHYEHFDDYDQISFPIYFDTDNGESDVVEIIRISPEDAPSLINEKTDARGRKKLAGTQLANFSAFLDAAWRVNDIMWGRLDGAERLIKSMLPDEGDRDIRDALTREAHQTILAEELSPAAQADLADLLGQALVLRKGGTSISDAIDKILKPVDKQVVKQRLTSVMTTCLQADELYTFMRDHYEVDRRFEPEPTLKVLGRATRVIGSILDDISRKRKVENKFTKWISRVGQIFLGLVEVSIPDSLWSLMFRHWLKLLYFLEVLLILGGILFSQTGVKSVGWSLLAVTFGVNLAVLVLRDLMRAKKRWLWLVLTLLLAVIGFFAAVGVDELLGIGVRKRVSQAAHRMTKGALGTPPETAPTPIPVLVSFPPSSSPSPTPSPSGGRGSN